MSSPKVIFIDNPFFAVNNKDNNFLLYKGKDKNGIKTIIFFFIKVKIKTVKEFSNNVKINRTILFKLKIIYLVIKVL